MLLRQCLQRWPRPCARLWRAISTRPYYVTTPIFYPNADPHIGHLYSLVVADVLARFRRVVNPTRPVQFLAGTDEHGLKIQRAAEAKGLPPHEFCDQLSGQFRTLAEKANISNTVFMRTTRPEHHKAVESIWKALEEKGLIYKASYSGWYSITDECFYSDDQITPSTSDPTAFKSTETGSAVEYTTEENYMFRLCLFRDPLLMHYTTSQRQSIFPPGYHAQIVSALSSEPLQDLSISRPRHRLSWGVPVPGDAEQTIYVWFDALLVYLSGVGYPWHEISPSTAWPVDVQVIGKDILRFHAIYLPAILQALHLPLQRQILVHAHWTVEGKKMSKSIGNVVDPIQAMNAHGVDIVRFYLMRVGGRFRDDTDWSQEQLLKHSRELRSLLGNLLLRATSPKILARARIAPPISLRAAASMHAEVTTLLCATHALPGKFAEHMAGLEVGEALDEVVDLLRLANKMFTTLTPWSPMTSPQVTHACRATALEALRVAGMCLLPFIPGAAGQLLEALGVREEERCWEEVEERNLEERWAKVENEGVDEGVMEGVKLF